MLWQPLTLLATVVGLTFILGCAAADPNIAGARMELRAGDFQRALELTDAAIQTDPQNADAYVVRGDIYLAMSEQAATHDERADAVRNMMESYRRAQQLDPANQLLEVRLLQAYGQEMNRGAAAFGEGADDQTQYVRAAAAFERASLIMPDSATAHLYQGLATLAGGETEAAAAPLREAINLGTDAPEAYLYLGRIYLATDRADDAITVLEEARRQFPDNDEIETELLNTYGRTGQIDRAIDAYGRVVEGSPDDPVLRYNYGSFLLQAQRYEDAVEQLERAVELDPTAGNAYYNLGAAYMNQAVEANEQLSDLDPTTPEGAQVQARRDALLGQALGPLEQAREIFTAEGEDASDVCRSLFRAYAQLRMNDEAREAAACAGIELD
jgi:tetratricopeptide (TPR) repeat protein